MDSFDDSQALSTIKYEQPKTHKKNKSCLECLVCCQIGESDLTQNQLKLFYTLKPLCNKLYEEMNPSHQAQLKDLFFLAFDKSLDSEDLNSTDWMIIGFQSKNAQTDFRGAGTLGLENLRLFVMNQKKLVEEMSIKEHEFLFAMTSLNITFHLKLFFHLADYLTYEKDRKIICSRDAFKNFAKLLENGIKLNLKKNETLEETLKRIFYEIHEILLIFCFKKWIHLRKIKRETTFMEFYKVFEEMKKLSSDIFNSDDFGSIPQLRDYFQKVKNFTL